MSKAPAFQFYPRDWVMSTRVLTPEQRGVYIDLLCFAWENGAIPADPAERAHLLEVHWRTERRLWLALQGFFVADGAGGLVPADAPLSANRTGFRRRASEALKALIFARDKHRCVACGATENLTLDHIFPYSLGGAETEDNLQLLCRYCNARKGARWPYEAPGAST